MSGLRRSELGHRADDRLLALDHLVVDARPRRSASSSSARRAAGPSCPPCRPSCCIWPSWSARSSRSNWPLASFLAMRSALAWSSSAAALSTRATTSPWPRMRPGHAAGVEHVERVDLLARAQELDRQAGDRAHRQRRAAARVAVGAGQDQAGQRQALVEGLGGAHRVLAGQAVGDQQGLGRRGDPGDLGRLAHHRLVERRAPGGVEDQHVEAAQPRRRAARGGRCRAPPGRRTIGRVVDLGLLAQRSPAAPWPPDGGCPARPSAPSCARRWLSRAPAWPRWWSCPSPAGRPSGSPPAAPRSGSAARAPRRPASRPGRRGRS